MTKSFIIINAGYPMHVHSADCRDLNMPKYRRAAKDYVRRWMMQ